MSYVKVLLTYFNPVNFFAFNANLCGSRPSFFRLKENYILDVNILAFPGHIPE